MVRRAEKIRPRSASGVYDIQIVWLGMLQRGPEMPMNKAITSVSSTEVERPKPIAANPPTAQPAHTPHAIGLIPNPRLKKMALMSVPNRHRAAHQAEHKRPIHAECRSARP